MVVMNSPTRKVLSRRALIVVATAAVVAAGCLIYRPTDPEVKELEEQRRRGTVVRELDVSLDAAERTVVAAFENLEIELVSVKDHDTHRPVLGSWERRRAEVKVALEAQGEYTTRMEVNARKWMPEESEDPEGSVTILPQGDTTLDVGVSIGWKTNRWEKSYAIEIADEVERLLERGEPTASLP